MAVEKFQITGMSCAACQANITRAVQKLPGVSEVNVSLLANQMTVEFDETAVTRGQIIDAVVKSGYGAQPFASGTREEGDDGGFRSEWNKRKKQEQDRQHSMKNRLLSSIVLLIPLMYIAMGMMAGWPMPSILTGSENAVVFAFTQLLITIPILLINRQFFISGWRGLCRKTPNMDSLVALGSGASVLYGIFAIYRMSYAMGHGQWDIVHHYHHELYFESAAMILTLVTVGKYLETRSKAKTSDALGKLLDLAPKTARVIRNGQEVQIPAEQVKSGDIVVIRPGESIPVDGVITSGYGFVDQSAITGESIPVEKKVDDEVISATINKNGTFEFRASRVGNDTTLAQIIRLVDEAGNTKAPIARLADKISGIFVPVVIGIAILTAAVWLLAGRDFEFALSCAISVLVISCPCALGLATPVAIMVGTGKAAEFGILIKSAQSLEQLHSVDTIVLDKTGTITSGHPRVTDVLVLDQSMTEQEFLMLAASVEAGSEHPLAEAIVEKAKQDEIAVRPIQDFEMISGRGVRAVFEGQDCLAGNMALCDENHVFASENERNNIVEILARLSNEGKTPLLFAAGKTIRGVIAVADTVRESSRAAIRAFAGEGLHVVMLTGDNRTTAEAIRAELDIAEVIADVLPTEKEACIRNLQEQGHKVAMVGDGINDAPALARADVGIAIGAGTDIAIDSADVVLMKDSLYDVAVARKLSRAVLRNIKMNLFWAFFYNILGIPVAAGALFLPLGIRLTPMIGSAAMSLSSVCVVTNALRLRIFKNDREEDGHVQTADASNRGADKKVLIIEGMMCNHCKMRVETALSGVDGVTFVNVNLEQKSAEVTLSREVSSQALIDAVTEAGYKVTSCV